MTGMARGKKRTLLLLIEDNPIDTQQIGEMLAVAAKRTIVMKPVACLAEGLRHLAREDFDAVLLDMNPADGSGTDTLQTVVTHHPKIPVIVILAADDEAATTRALEEGAQDYLIKGQLNGSLIIRAIRYAIEINRGRQQILEIEDQIDNRVRERTAQFGLINKELTERNEFNVALFEHNPIETIVVDLEGRIVNFNLAKRLSKGGIPKIGDLMYHDYAGRHHNDMRMELMDTIGSGAVRYFPEQKYGDRYLAITISPFSQGAIITSQDITAQRAAQETIRESEEKYRLVVENSINGVAIIQDGRLRYLNRTACAIIGYPEDELLGRQFGQFIAPDDRNELLREYERRLSGDERTYPTTFRLIGKDKSIRWAETAAVTVTWGGQPALLAFIRDITDQRRAETLLRDSEEQYRDLVENIEDIIYIIDDVGTILFANGASERFTGYKKDELLKKSFRELILPESYGRAGEIFKRQIAGEDVGTFELRLMKKNGQSIVLETRERPVWDNGRIVEIHGLGRDITDRKRTEEMLRQFEEKWRNFIETSRDVIFLTTLEGKVVDVNPAGLALSGYEREEFVGKDIAESYADPHGREPFIASIIEKGFVNDQEIDFLRKDGSIAHCLITATQRRDKGGNVIGFQGIIKDITEKKNLEQQLIQAQKMEAIVALAGGIAHNFNNILVGIMGYSEYLLSKKGPDDHDYKALKTIHEGTIKASTLVKQLLDAARVGQYHPARVNLNEVINGILPLIQGTFDKSIEIATHLSRGLMIVEADAGQLEQSLLNLCINARDAMPSGGKLIIETVNRRLDKNFADTHLGLQEGAYVVLSVTDTGIGMTPEVTERIFEPFFTTKEQAGGKGMGLSTVYGIMKNHGGRITVYSEIGKGTTFRLYFPAAAEPSMDTEAEHDRQGEKVLIIDDDPVVRDLWSGFLTEHGFTVIVAESGPKGIERLNARPDEIDLAIVDLVMPGMGGKETIARLRETKPDIKVLGCSGYSVSGQAQDMVSMDVDGFIQKPSQLSDLVEIVRKILKQ
jgi:two-component system cell cycle sensor histidine kinase/response regulator CckA